MNLALFAASAFALGFFSASQPFAAPVCGVPVISGFAAGSVPLDEVRKRVENPDNFTASKIAPLDREKRKAIRAAAFGMG